MNDGSGSWPLALSPALALPSSTAGPAYEVKFLLADDQADMVEAWAKERLTVDPHAQPDLGNAYRITSLYLDTPELHVFHRLPPYQRRKLRVRYYDDTQTLFLERKSRTGDRVRKKRTAIAAGDLARLQDPHLDPTWTGAWFHRRVCQHQLSPFMSIRCWRSAFFGSGVQGSCRLTLDRRIHWLPTRTWDFAPGQEGRALLAGHVIMEMKFRQAMPGFYKQLLQAMALTPCAISKYRLAMRAWQAEVH